MSQAWRSYHYQGFGWKQDVGPSNRKAHFQKQPLYASIQEKTSKLEDTLEKFMQASFSNQKNIEASIRNLET